MGPRPLPSPHRQPDPVGLDLTNAGVIAALAEEAAAWQRGTRGSGPSVAAATISGLGAMAATRCAQRLLADGRSGLISWGTAAGLAPELTPGSLLLPRAVVASDATRLEVHPQWRAAALQRLSGLAAPDPRELAEATELLSGAARKRDCRERTGAAAADMESAAIGRVAVERAAPWLVVRVVVDDAAMALPEVVLTSMADDGRVAATRLLRELARRPSDLVPLLRLARAYAQARRQLVRAAARLAA